MGTLDTWIIHRSTILGLSWPEDVADLSGVEPATLAQLAGGEFRLVGRSARAYVARALKVSVRDIEALATGRIKWIDDARQVDPDWLRPLSSRPQPARAVAMPCKPAHGIPILGRILATGRIEHDENWTPEDGRRLAFRYPGIADPFALELLAAAPPYAAGAYLVFQTILPGQLQPGDMALLTSGEREAETELAVVDAVAPASLLVRPPLSPDRATTRIATADILRAAQVIGSPP